MKKFLCYDSHINRIYAIVQDEDDSFESKEDIQCHSSTRKSAILR